MFQPVQVGLPAGGIVGIEVNRKLGDARDLAPGDADAGGDRLPPAAGLWAWYGHWQDRNGNGVIDDAGPLCSAPEANSCWPPSPEDEWTWVGNCSRYLGLPGIARADLCRRESTAMLAWVWPGNHHGGSWGAPPPGVPPALPPPLPAQVLLGLPADVPGRQVLCAAHILAEGVVRRLPGGLAVDGGLACPERYEDLDAWGEDRAGDPLLDAQGSVAPDLAFADRTGDPSPDYRQWVGTGGVGPMAFYDDGLLVTTVVVSSVFAPPCGPCDAPALATAAFTDVDVFPAAHPALDALVQATVKPAARGIWLAVRGLLQP